MKVVRVCLALLACSGLFVSLIGVGLALAAPLAAADAIEEDLRGVQDPDQVRKIIREHLYDADHRGQAMLVAVGLSIAGLSAIGFAAQERERKSQEYVGRLYRK